MFSPCLSRDFTSKLGGYLAMEYSHMKIPFKNKNFKIMNEAASSFHTEKIAQDNVLYGDTKIVNPIKEELEIVDQFSNDILYQFEDIGHINYHIY